IKKLRSNNPNMKTVVMYDEYMNPVKKFRSVRDAERESGIKRQLIKFSCKDRGKACGCYFRFSDEEFGEREDWKHLLEIREYNYKPLSVKVEIEKVKDNIFKSNSYRDLIDKMGFEYSERLRRKIFDLVKRNEIDTSHFKRTKK